MKHLNLETHCVITGSIVLLICLVNRLELFLQLKKIIRIPLLMFRLILECIIYITRKNWQLIVILMVVFLPRPGVYASQLTLSSESRSHIICVSHQIIGPFNNLNMSV